MALNLDADLTFMVSDAFGDTVTFGAVTASGIVTLATEEDGIKGGDSVVLGKTRVLVFPLANFPGLVGGTSPSAITVTTGIHAGNYTVTSIHAEDDGRKARAYLRNA